MSKYLRVTMPDGSKWDVPAERIAQSRAQYFSERYGESYEDLVQETLDDDLELCDWASNNMNWDEVEDYAIQTRLEDHGVDYQEGWINGKQEVVEVE